jgi:hypothetical protein
MFQASSTAETWAVIAVVVIVVGAFCIGVEHLVLWLFQHVKIVIQ